MNDPLFVIDRATNETEEEKIFGEKALKILWGYRCLVPFLLLISKLPWISAFYGWLKKQPFSKKEIAPFINKYNIDSSEFNKKIDEFTSFNDFFIRTLKKECRPIAPTHAICPADGRYSFLSKARTDTPFLIKGQQFTITSLLNKPQLPFSFVDLVFIRLCPLDYHRFHFPCDGVAEESHLIKGSLFSVNPLALHQRKTIFVENRRRWTLIHTPAFGKMVMVEIGATFVGSIEETYNPGPVIKGDEKGFFAFGGSAILLIFDSDRFSLAPDLIAHQAQGLEIKSRFGEALSN